MSVAAQAASATSAPAAPAAARRTGVRRVASSRVAFDLANTNNSSVLCVPQPDGKAYPVRGRLVGPRAVFDGRVAVVTVNVLVHDAGTGAWFFNLRSNPTYDYATRLAERGQTSLVLDRLGYGRSPLADGDDTWGAALIASLARGGEGTLIRRFTTGVATKRVRAKTGYLDGVSSMAGRVVSRGGQRYAFAVVANTGDITAARAIQERVVVMLASGTADTPAR